MDLRASNRKVVAKFISLSELSIYLAEHNLRKVTSDSFSLN